MESKTIKALEARIAKLEREAVKFRKGVVSATSPIEAKFGGSDTAQEVNTVVGPSFAVDANVAALTSRNDALIIGEITDTPSAGGGGSGPSLATSNPSSIQPDDAAAPGIGTAAARSDHTHAISAGSASTVSGTNAEGTSTSFARADHNHALGTDVVGSAQIAADAVGSSEIAADAVGASEIATGAVGTTELADDSVTAAKIAADAVGSSEIAADAVGSAEIAADAVTSSEIATDAVGSAEIAAGAVGTSELADDAVTSAKLADDASTDANRAVTSDHIRNSAITSAKIATNAVGNSQIDTDAVDSDEIKANAVGTTEIANLAVTDGKLAGSISNSKLATNPLDRTNHTGTQTASTISNFDTQVRTSRLDQMATPTAAVSMGSQKITNLATPPTDNADAASKAYVDGAILNGGSLNYSSYFGTPMFMGTAPASTASGAANNQRTAYLLVQSSVTVTGIIYRVGSTASGNVKAGLWSTALGKLAETTATVAQATANTSQSLPFASTYTLTPGYYYISLTFSSSTATFQGAVSLAPAWSQTNGTFAATAPTGFATAGLVTVPSMLTY